jgi:hypothetical protein
MSELRLTLGPDRRRAVSGCSGFYVRIRDDLRKTVVFFGTEDGTPGKGGINCIGTGFLVAYDGAGYLVTAKHLAHELGNDPFLLRLNKTDGTSFNLLTDGAHWAEHPDPAVDVALVPFHLSVGGGYDFRYLPFDRMAADELIERDEIGIGDLTYTVGLFRVMSGARRNLPVVHFGTISLMPGDEQIPIRDWRDRGKILDVEGYLVETQALEGLSGSPVFVRVSVPISLLPSNMLVDPRSLNPDGTVPASYAALAPRQDVFILGLWQGSWDVPAGQGIGSGRIPAGMGIVVPSRKIRETLDLEPLRLMREGIKERQQRERAANPDSTDSALPVAGAPVVESGPPAT